ncbi:MAG TPA: hypothetical protein VET23_03670, partial [Chitinophagaceae bacterium]|nr:hypothetical protein [Chitinophagaceae bacterium]
AWKNNNWLRLGFLFMLASNYITKTFFWVAHQQMFAVLTPLLCVYIGIIIIQNNLSYKKTLFLTLGSGVLLLFYGNFLLLLPVILFSYLFKRKKQSNQPVFFSFFQALSVICCFFLPTFLWMIYLKIIGVNYYSAEISSYRQFIWIIDSIKISPVHFINAFYLNTLKFLKTSGSLYSSVIILMSILINKIFFRQTDENNSKTIFPDFDLLKFTLFIFILFFWLLGYYADRLTFSINPLLLIFTALMVNKEKISSPLAYFLIALFLGFYVYIFYFPAPHFSEYLFFS